jgi:tricarballylate dehydrogenase
MQIIETDVAIVGCGAAGLTTALAALEAGANVIVLERSTVDERGGNTRWTEALLRLDADGDLYPDFIEAFAGNAGHHVTPEFIHSTAGDYGSWPAIVKALPFTDPELLGAFVSGIPDVLEWLRSHGLQTQPARYPLPPALAGEIPGITGGGLAIIETLCPVIEALRGKILYETTATRLLRDEDDRVVGVRATDGEHRGLEIRASAVVLACGGFEGNPAMTVQYMGPEARFMRPVARGGWYNRGEGIRMALDANAAPAGDYAECHRQPIDPRSSRAEALVHAYPLGILVNLEGQRFLDEAPDQIAGYLEEPLRRLSRQPRGLGFFIYDSQIEETANWRTMIRSDAPAIEADSLEALANEIGVPAANLAATVVAFNAACPTGPIDTGRLDGNRTTGLVPAKSNWARPLTKAPFGCYPIIASNTLTLGGLKVTANGQVVNASGVPIPGLYAAGETIGMYYGDYIGATSVLRALVFGRLAGSHAATMRG